MFVDLRLGVEAGVNRCTVIIGNRRSRQGDIEGGDKCKTLIRGVLRDGP